MKYLLPFYFVFFNLAVADDAADQKRWAGVYTSTVEIFQYESTSLSLTVEKLPSGKLYATYRKSFYTDYDGTGEIPQDEYTGSCFIEKNVIYIPKAVMKKRGDKTKPSADITRFTMGEINGKTVLFNDVALELYRDKKELHDYGILVKVSDKPLAFGESFAEVKHTSIKALYLDPKKPWRDPFVFGPNDGK